MRSKFFTNGILRIAFILSQFSEKVTIYLKTTFLKGLALKGLKEIFKGFIRVLMMVYGCAEYNEGKVRKFSVPIITLLL